MESDCILITQARVGSSRLPQKVLKEINGVSLLKIHLDRVSKAAHVDNIIVATTVEEADQIIEEQTKEWGYTCFRGAENDVLARFYDAILDSITIPKWIVRVTSDCPLLDPKLINKVITFAKNKDVDYVSNSLEETFPDGQDIEVFKFSALEKAYNEAVLKSDREHVTPFLRANANGNGLNYFKMKNFRSETNYAQIRMTVDEPKDFDLIEQLVTKLGVDEDWETYTKYIIDNELYKINSAYKRNEGYFNSLKKDKN